MPILMAARPRVPSVLRNSILISFITFFLSFPLHAKKRPKRKQGKRRFGRLFLPFFPLSLYRLGFYPSFVTVVVTTVFPSVVTSSCFISTRFFFQRLSKIFLE